MDIFQNLPFYHSYLPCLIFVGSTGKTRIHFFVFFCQKIPVMTASDTVSIFQMCFHTFGDYNRCHTCGDYAV